MTLKFSDIQEKNLVKGISGKYIHTENNTVGYIEIKNGAVLPAHSHIHEQITQVISGKLEMTIDGVTQILESGSITIIPSNSVHSAFAHTDCIVIDTFFPVREDYK
ncbi:cupin domain-containing protein [Algibacter marinivivus]|uniref:Cupin domain-containing protein n=1 Tax=Algibacter marinivivus TaxID=2100723 RepID=A0A2U2X1P1_9FLAO|nr:cupin domain-containing protein [Algibacter marinivivus]PWH81698.1 cupin domain-containing protein [Algibacter marinivivus]